MHLRCRVGGLLLALAAFACHRGDTSTPTDASDGGTQADGSSPGDSPPASRREGGAGHTANIDLVALSSDGTAAISRDQIGGVRLWPTLDGATEPVALPVQGAATISVEPREGGGWTVAIVEPVGGAKLLHVDARGAVVIVGELAPFAPLFGAWVLPGGERVLALFKDHTVRLLDGKGTELARLEERRFRPTELRLAQDGKTVVAVAREGASVLLQRVAVRDEGGKPKLALVGKAREIKPGTSMTPSGAALSPDGARWAYVDRLVGNAWEIVSIELANESGELRFTAQVAPHLNPNIGFSGPESLLVSASDGSLSWLVDVTDGTMRPRDAAPQDFQNQGRAQAVGAGIQVAGHGTWMFVHDVATRRQRFLGYRAFQTQSVAVSPSGEHVAWALMQGPLTIEPVSGDGPSFEITPDDGFGTFRVRFTDDDHVITVDGAGGIRLYEWRTGRLVDGVGVTGGVRALHFERERGLLLVERHNNDARVWSVSPEGFTGPWIIADSSFRSGLLAPPAAADKAKGDKAVVWTLDSANKIRRYTMTDLKADLTREQIDKKGKDIGAGKVAPLAIDRFGRQYGVRWNGSAMEVFVDLGKHIKSAPAPSGDITQIIPSHDGTRFIAIHQRGQSTSLSMHDADTLEERWTYSTGIFNNEVEWSPDGRIVAIAANTGAALLDASTGKALRRRCGIEFRATGSPPSTAFNGVNLRSLCEP
jgi:hypothetical protein